MRRTGSFLVAVAGPWILAALAFATCGSGPAETGLRLGLFLIFALAALATWAGRLSTARLVLDAAFIASAFGAAWALALTCDFAPADRGKAAAIVAAGLAVPWAFSLPVRAVPLVGLGRIVLLASAAVLLATPWLIPSPLSDLPSGSVSSPYGKVPSWVAAWNPLARLHGSLLPQDWFHGPALYPRVGERPYDYPAWNEDVAAPLLSAAAALVLGLLLHGASRRRSRVAEPAAEAGLGGREDATMLGTRGDAATKGPRP